MTSTKAGWDKWWNGKSLPGVDLKSQSQQKKLPPWDSNKVATQLDGFFRRLEIDGKWDRFKDGKGKLALECGCGSG